MDNKELQTLTEIISQLRKEIQEDIQTSQREVMVFIENVTDKKIQVLAEGHQDILDRLPDTKKVEDLQQRISVLETAVEKHDDEIEKLKRA